MLRVLVPCLSHLKAPAAVLCVDLDDSMLLRCPLSLQPVASSSAVCSQAQTVVFQSGWSLVFKYRMLHLCYQSLLNMCQRW